MRNPNDVTVVPLNIFQNIKIRVAIKGNKIFINISVINDNNATNELSIAIWGQLYCSRCFRNDPTHYHPEICKLCAVINKIFN